MAIESTESAPLTDGTEEHNEQQASDSPESLPGQEGEQSEGMEGSQPSEQNPEATPAEGKKVESPLDAIGKALGDAEKAEKPETRKAGIPPAKTEEVKKDQGKKPVDDVHKMPEGLRPKAQERFHALSRTAKEHEGRARELTGQIGAIQDIVRESGATPDEFVQTMTFLQDLKSNSKEGLQRAMGVIENVRHGLAQRLGIEAPGVDLLHDAPDLKKEVEEYQITKERAVEIANSRRAARQGNDERERQRGMASQEAAFNGEKQAAITEINKLSAEWHKSDIDFRPKAQYIAEVVKSWAKDGTPFSPQQWPAVIKQMYADLSKGSSLTKKPEPKIPPPLRPNGLTGGHKVPQTAIEAMNQKLAAV